MGNFFKILVSIGLTIASQNAFGFARGLGVPLANPDLRATGLAAGQRIVFSQVTGTYDGISNTELDTITDSPRAPSIDAINGDGGIPGTTVWVTGAFSSAMPTTTCPSSSAGQIAITAYHYTTRNGSSTTLNRKTMAIAMTEERMITECKRNALLAMNSNGAIKFVLMLTNVGGATYAPASACSFDISYTHQFSCGVCVTGSPGC